MIISSTTATIREAARRKLPPFLFHYIDGGAYAEQHPAPATSRTWQAIVPAPARAAGHDSRLRPGDHACSTSTLRHAGVILAPVGLTGMYTRRGEVPGGQGGGLRSGVPFTLSTVSVCPI